MNNKKNKVKLSPVWIIFWVFLLGGIGGGLYYREVMTEEALMAIAQLESELSTEKNAVSALQKDFSNAKAQEARDRANKFKMSMLSRAEVNAITSSYAEQWNVNKIREDDNDEYILSRYQLMRGSSGVADWEMIYNTILDLDKRSGFVLDTLDISTAGDNRQRMFSRVSIALQIYIKKPGDEGLSKK